MRKILVIGIGAGHPEHITIQAINALKSVDVVFITDKGADKAELAQFRREICARYVPERTFRTVVICDPDRDRAPADYRAAVANWHDQRAALYETTLFRIAQESLTNAARYAHAQRVWLSLMHDQNSISLQVRDDGCGFDPLQKHAGLGIAGMRERATLLEGTLTIISQPGQGTTVEVCLPWPTSCVEDAVHA